MHELIFANFLAVFYLTLWQLEKTVSENPITSVLFFGDTAPGFLEANRLSALCFTTSSFFCLPSGGGSTNKQEIVE